MTARKDLRRFAHLGIVTEHDGRPTTYERYKRARQQRSGVQISCVDVKANTKTRFRRGNGST